MKDLYFAFRAKNTACTSLGGNRLNKDEMFISCGADRYIS